ncbi:GLOBIN domain-containing protein [Aphelenchoides fujianensis]|nr:GLOBIN domain-containing protein [Aphelenchoides fujianensis]
MTDVPRICKVGSSSFDYGLFAGHGLCELAAVEVSRLTPERIKIIRETFAVMKRHFTHNCLSLFLRLFSEYPLYKDIWPQFRAIPDSSLMYSQELKKHVQMFSRGFNSIVEKLENGDELQELLRKYAKLHSKRSIYKTHIMNMHTEYMIVLRSLGVESKADIEDAWHTFFDAIGNLVDPMKTELKAV